MFGRGIEVKNPEQLALMRRAGLVVADTLSALRAAVVPGVTTGDLDALAREQIASAGATSNFLGYHGFTGVICTSVNEEIVHGIPGDRTLREGDLLSIDCGAVVEGWHGDAAITVPVGQVEARYLTLIEVTDDALWHGIAAARPGAKIGDISHAVEQRITSRGDYGITGGFTGHGIGTAMHQPPDVPNRGRPGRGPKIVPGMAIAIEPMVTMGSSHSVILEDDWTAVTPDGSWAAHVEHSIAITDAGICVLTAHDGGAERLGALGVPFVEVGHP